MKTRADVLLVERGFFESRARAQAAIASGLVRADGIAVRKPAAPLDMDAHIEAAPAHPWVSRGGVKLAAALDHFHIDPAGKTCLDVGASTGGFSHVLIERGASKVFAVDVGHDQLHVLLRNDPRVVSLEGFDARNLTENQIDMAPGIVVCDTSFISLKLVLPNVLRLARKDAQLVALLKPQFEAGRALVKKGIVRDAQVHARLCDELSAFVESQGWQVIGVLPSPIEGGDGNCEFLIGAAKRVDDFGTK